MARKPHPTERVRSAQLGVMLTPQEKQRVARLAGQEQRSLSDMGRLLILRGLAAMEDRTEEGA